jgi:hypothetical protein
VWRPIRTAPRDGTFIIVASPSGYVSTPLRAAICRYDAEYRPKQPWVTHSGNSFLDGGEEPTLWMPIPELPAEDDRITQLRQLFNAGAEAAIGYGDNVNHFQGKQREEIFYRALERFGIK